MTIRSSGITGTVAGVINGRQLKKIGIGTKYGVCFLKLIWDAKKKAEDQLRDIHRAKREALAEPVGPVANASHSADYTPCFGPLFNGREETLKKVIRLCKAAEEKVHAGTYGVCEECGKAMDPRRLEAVPFATNCVPCKQIKEKRTYKGKGDKHTAWH